MFEHVSNSPPGTAGISPLPLPGQVKRTAWIIRKTTPEIEALKAITDLRFQQRAGMYHANVNGKIVEVLTLMIAVGSEPFGPSSISLGIAGNEHQEGVYGGLLENLTTQDIMPVVFVGDSKNIEFNTATENTLRPFARKALAELSKLEPWSDSDFQLAVLDMQRNNPDMLALWNKLGGGTVS